MDKQFIMVALGIIVTLGVASYVTEGCSDKKFLSKELHIEYQSLDRDWFSRTYVSNGSIWKVTGTIERTATCISEYNN